MFFVGKHSQGPLAEVVEGARRSSVLGAHDHKVVVLSGDPVDPLVDLAEMHGDRAFMIDDLNGSVASRDGLKGNRALVAILVACHFVRLHL
jgi:hypothetical protein